MIASITIHRPTDPRRDDDGDLEIYVEGEVGHIEAPSRDCPGDAGDVDLNQGPYELKWRKWRVSGAVVYTVLSADEERRAKEAIREAAYDELRGTRAGRRILGSLG